MQMFVHTVLRELPVTGDCVTGVIFDAPPVLEVLFTVVAFGISFLMLLVDTVGVLVLWVALGSFGDIIFFCDSPFGCGTILLEDGAVLTVGGLEGVDGFEAGEVC